MVRIATAIAITVTPTLAHAQQLPTGGAVASGSASINQSGNTLNINQSTNQAIINWNSFSVGQGGTVNFNQPGASSATLNRVTGTTPSSIAGTINAPGTVLLVNPNGIAITRSGVINTGSFAASTLDIKDSDFLAGKYRFSGNGGSAAVTNNGRVNVSDGGFAALLGGQVANNGVISARLGRVGLGSGELMTLDLAGDGFLSVAVPSNRTGGLVGANGKALVSNKGRIIADGGMVYLSAATAAGLLRDAVNVPGSIRANAVGTSNGKIVIGGGAGGKVRVSGKLAATSKTGTGGTIAVSGAKVALGATARLDVSGKTGGTLLIGGDYQGGGKATKFASEPIQNALVTTIAAGATLKADGSDGKGGNIVVWSDDLTTYAGSLSATGGGSGAGGFAEVSGHRLLDFTGTADLKGPGGFGTLLLDPYNITISNAPDSGMAIGGGSPRNLNASGTDSILNTTTLYQALNGANVIVSTGGAGSAGNEAGNITVANSFSWVGSATLTLDAYGSIFVNASFGNTLNGTSLILRADNSGTGTGTVSFANGATIMMDKVSIYYNPTGSSTTVNATKYGTGSQVSFNDHFSGAAQPMAYMLVNTVSDLQNMQNNLTGNYALGRDIDASVTSSWNAGVGFAPVGNVAAGFTGILDGQNHAIDGLTIDRPTGLGTGLFGFIGAAASIRNLVLSDVNVTGGSYTGALAGVNNGTIKNIFVSGSVVGAGTAQWIGGIVGGAISGPNSIYDSTSTANVTGYSGVGGLAGNVTSVYRSSATGDILANLTSGGAGGLVASASGPIVDSYSTGTVTGGAAGGLLSDLQASGSITGSWSSARLSGGVVGGIAAYAYGTPSISNSYWDTTTSGTVNAVGSTPGPISGATGLTSAQARTQASYTGFDFTNTWYTIDGETRPMLRREYSTNIRTANQLQLIGMNATTLAANYTLANDIDLGAALSSASGMWGASGWSPIGSFAQQFSGTFNGQNHALDGLMINRPGVANTGLFAATSTSTISNLALTNVNVTGGNNTGALTGANGSTITNLFVSGRVTGGQNVGGLAGGLNGDTSISGSTSLANVTGASGVGGLAGNAARIERSTATGDIRASNGIAGGLVGDMFQVGEVVDSYFTGTVNASVAGGLVGSEANKVTRSWNSGSVVGSAYAGGLVGDNSPILTVTNSYWDATTSGVGKAVGDVAGAVSGATGLTSPEARAQSPYSGFDFANTWYLINGDTRPFLRSEYSTNIRTANQLQLIGMNATTLAADYKLANDINLGAVLSNASGMWGDKGWAPIRNYSGNFDGQYHRLSGLTINRTILPSGLFGSVSSGSVTRIGLDNVNIVGDQQVGALVGSLHLSTVSDSYATGAVTGTREVGGLIGTSNGSTVTRSYANVAASASGLYSYVGGLIGEQTGGTTSQVYSSGFVRGADPSGALFGQGNGFGNTNGYYDVSTSGKAGVGTAQTTAQLQAALPAGFDTNWGIIAGQSYPYLKGFFPGGAPQVISGTAYTNNGTTAASGVAVTGLVNGTSAGSIYSGANGYYNILTAPNAIAANSQVLAYTSAGGTVTGVSYRQDAPAGPVTGLDVNGTFLTMTSAAASMSAVNAGLAIANGGAITYALPNLKIAATGAAFNINQSLSVTGSMLVQASGALSIASGVTLAAGGSGDAIVLTNGTTFTNNAGSGALVLSGGGRYLIYSQNAANDNNGGLSGTVVAGTYAGNPPASIAAGNHFVYAASAVTTITYVVADASSTYGSLATLGAVTLSGNPSGVSAVVTVYDSSNNAVMLSATSAAGVYTQVVTSLAGANASSYAIAGSGNTIGTLTIGKATLSVTANSASKTYDGAAFSGGNGVSYSGFVNGETASVLGGTLGFGGTAQGAKNAGSYTLTASGLTSGNYTIGYTAGALTIGKAALSVTANDASKTYDGLAFSGGNGVSYSGFVNSETSAVLGGTLLYGGAAQGAVNAGSYALTASGLTSGNYTIAYNAGSLTIGKAALSVTANDQSKVYDGAAFSGGNGVSYSGFVNGETSAVLGGTLAYGGTAQGARNAGSYTLTASGLTSGNYTIGYTAGALSIGKAALSVTANDASKTYDGAAFSGGNGVSYGGFVNGETSAVVGGTLAYGGTAQGAKNAGSYTLTASGLTSGNYTIGYTTGALTIGKAALSVTANDASKTYDGAAFSGGNGVSFSGFVNGETSAVVGGTLAYGGTAQNAKDAGSYTLTASGLTSGNYTIGYTAGALTIGKAALSVTANDQSKVYGGSFTFTGSEFTTQGLAAGDAITSVTLASAGAASSASAGQYAITASNAAGSGLSNYTISYTPGTLNVSTAPLLVVTANDATKTYGAALSFNGTAFSTQGLANGDSVSAVSLTSAGAASNANAGQYAINVSNAVGTGLSNYSISYMPGTLTVNPASLTVAANDGSKTYDGAAFSGGNGVSYSGFVNGETSAVLGGTLAYGGTAQGARNAGSYTLTASGLTSGNYTIAYTGATFVINPRAITVTANAQSKTYDNNVATDPALTYVVGGAGLVPGDSLSGGLFRTVGQNAWAYPIGPGTLGNSNYTIAYTSANYVINPRAIAVTPNDLTKTYGAADPALTYAVGGLGLAAGDSQASVFTGALTRTAGESVAGGPYAITQGTLATHYNYEITSFTPGSLSITPAGLTVTALLIGSVGKTYDGSIVAALSAANLGLSGVQSGDTANVTVSAAGASYDNANAGTNKMVTATGLALAGSAASNYTLTSTTVQAAIGTIDPRAITVTADAQSKQAGQGDPWLSYQITAGNLAGSDSLAGALDRLAGESTGVYAIGQGTLAASANYRLSFIGATLSINDVPVIATPTTGPLANGFEPGLYQPRTPGGALPVVTIRYQLGTANAPAIGVAPRSDVSSTASIGRTIASTGGATDLFLPISQFDAAQYTNATLPDFAAQAGEATVLTMIARAAENSREVPSINLLWSNGAPDWRNPDNRAAALVVFTNGNGQTATPGIDSGFAFVNGTTDVAALLRNGPLMLGGGQSADPATWLLAIAMTEDGKGIIANDPATGTRVVLAYDPATKIVGGLAGLMDASSGALVPLGDTMPALRDGVPANAWDALKSFSPQRFFAVAIERVM